MCIGVSASARRDCVQKPQSSAGPPDLALTSEHMSVESAKRSTRDRHAQGGLDLAERERFVVAGHRRQRRSMAVDGTGTVDGRAGRL